MSEKAEKKSANKDTYVYSVGRRKRSSARAKLYLTGKPLEIKVNGKPLEVYFPDFYAKTILNSLTNLGITTGRIELFIRGGGISGQAEGARLAIAKALVKNDENLRLAARMHGYLTSDIRHVLPKRTGFRKNRKKEQWSKR